MQFGGSSFGNSAFGASNSGNMLGGGFGSANNKSATFGGSSTGGINFGGNQQQPAGGNNIFGGGGGGSSFGSTFGNASTPRTPLGGGFGSNTSTAQPWSLGATSNATPQVGGFGQQQNASKFGVPSLNFSSINPQQQQASAPFGQSPASTFGQPSTTSTFGQSSAPSAFGQPASSTFGGMNSNSMGFGGGMNMGGPQVGTANTKFQATPVEETVVGAGNKSTRVTNHIQVITAMPAYQSKSIEELRMEDYAKGYKGI